MTNKIIDKIKDTSGINYDRQFVDEQLFSLEELKNNNIISSGDENMHLTIICSALRYYFEMSPVGYGEEIIKIIERLESIYGVEELLESIMEDGFLNT